MGKVTGISWCHHTFNPWIGCARVSPACEHCYAEVSTFARRMRSEGTELWGVKAHRHVTSDSYWRQPLKWNNEAAAAGERRRVFCGSLCDLFEDREDLVGTRLRLQSLVRATPYLDWLFLTKRIENAQRLWPWNRIWPNIWLGTTVESQKYAELRLPELVKVEGPVIKYVSYEPALEYVDFSKWLRWIHWLIIGGESGSHARDFYVDWARDAIGQCRLAGTAPFMKQVGRVPMEAVSGGGLVQLRLNDKTHGGDVDEWPVEIQVREFPQLRAA